MAMGLRWCSNGDLEDGQRMDDDDDLQPILLRLEQSPNIVHSRMSTKNYNPCLG